MDALTKHIQHINALPPLPDTLSAIQKVAHDPFSTFKEIAEVIQKDPLLSANILKLSNSPMYGLKESVTTLQQAISMFGISTVIGFSMIHSINNALNVDFAPYRIPVSRFLETATTQNAIAFQWKRGLSAQQNDIFMTASFLMEIGSLLISDYLIREHLVERFQHLIDSGKSLIEAEEDLCGFTHQSIGASMFEEWGFDPAIITVIRQSASDKAEDPIAKRLLVISSAVNLKDTLSEVSIQASIQIAEKLGFNTSELSAILSPMRDKSLS